MAKRRISIENSAIQARNADGIWGILSEGTEEIAFGLNFFEALL
jgi:hypothetical protein